MTGVWNHLLRCCSLTQRDKGVHAFPKGISLKVNVIAWLEFELTYYDVTVQHVSHIAMETTPGLLGDASILEVLELFDKHQLIWDPLYIDYRQCKGLSE